MHLAARRYIPLSRAVGACTCFVGRAFTFDLRSLTGIFCETLMSSKRRITERRVAGLLGLAFDADDGQKRITRGKNFLLAGGSEETHGLMRNTIVKVTETLDERGINLTDVSVEELRELLDEAQT
jgi:hypothetical protein